MDCRTLGKLLWRYDFATQSHQNEIKEHCSHCHWCNEHFNALKVIDADVKTSFQFTIASDYWQGYYATLKRLLRAHTLRDWLAERFALLRQLITTPLLGPIPAYALVALIFLMSWFGLLSKNSISGGAFNNDLVVHPQELVATDNIDGAAVYQIASR